jgi:hypothetical protein
MTSGEMQTVAQFRESDDWTALKTTGILARKERSRIGG